MSLTSHLHELRKRHQNLSEQVEQEQRSPGGNDLHIAELKKQKLRLKEEIAKLTQV
ncbi:MAG: YdcH family protein [Paracoccaceae bacterium]